jgi:hypothetical protein
VTGLDVSDGCIGSPYRILAICFVDMGSGAERSVVEALREDGYRFGKIGSPYRIFRHCEFDAGADCGGVSKRSVVLPVASGGRIGGGDASSPSYFWTSIQSWTSVTRSMAVIMRWSRRRTETPLCTKMGRESCLS